MHQAQVTTWGEPPKYVEVPEPSAPGPDEIRIKVQAVGVHRVVRSRASGQHYSSGKPPHVPGIDGVGSTEDGKTVYFASFHSDILSEYVNMPTDRTRILPAGVDSVQAAGMVNPIMSSYMALKTRTTDLPKDFSVLILGATSASGRCAISVARLLGAKRIVGAARNQAALDTLGLDQTIVVKDPVKETDFSTLGDVDVILDYLYGPVASHLFGSLKLSKPTQYIHVGGLTGAEEISLPGAVLRSNNLTIRGSGPGAWSMKEVSQLLDGMLQVLKDTPEQPIRVAKLADVEKVWDEPSNERLVFVL